MRVATETQIMHFGQTPRQLFIGTAHPPRSVALPHATGGDVLLCSLLARGAVLTPPLRPNATKQPTSEAAPPPPTPRQSSPSKSRTSAQKAAGAAPDEAEGNGFGQYAWVVMPHNDLSSKRSRREIAQPPPLVFPFKPSSAARDAGCEDGDDETGSRARVVFLFDLLASYHVYLRNHSCQRMVTMQLKK